MKLAVELESTDAESESWWLEDLLARAQISRLEFLSQVTAGPCAAVGCVEEE